jgi:hypothetical protein
VNGKTGSKEHGAKNKGHSKKRQSQNLLIHFFPHALRPTPIESPYPPAPAVRQDCQTDLLCCFEIDYKLKLRRLLHGKINRLGAFQDLSTYDQPAGWIRKLRPSIHLIGNFDSRTAMKVQKVQSVESYAPFKS